MKPFTNVAVVVFALVAVLQIVRVVAAWEVTIGGVSIPLWASVLAFLIALTLCVMVWRESRRGRPPYP